MPHKLSLSRKAGQPTAGSQQTEETEQTPVCSECRHWPPHSLVIANQDHHFPIQPAHSRPLQGLPRGLLLKSAADLSGLCRKPHLDSCKNHSGERQAGTLSPDTHPKFTQGNSGPVSTHTYTDTAGKEDQTTSPEIRSIHHRTLQCDGCHSQRRGRATFHVSQTTKEIPLSSRTE